MITERLMEFFFTLVENIVSLFPVVEVPDWMSADGVMATVFTYAGQMGAWFPVSELVAVLGSLIVVWGIAFVIKIIRIIASFLTAGGGSAA